MNNLLKSLVLLFLFPISSLADDLPTEEWGQSGNYSVSWYNNNNTEFTLTTAKELAGMAYLVNNGYTDFKDKIIKLGADIDLSGKFWTPCGRFKGVFDGQSHVINGFSLPSVINSSSSPLKVGFGAELEGATVKDLTLKGTTMKVQEGTTGSSINIYFGALAGYANMSCNIENCVVEIDVEYSKRYDSKLSLGGIIGYADLNQPICNCRYSGQITCKSENAYSGSYISIGGICGKSRTEIIKCESLCPSISLIDRNGNSYDAYRYISGICGVPEKQIAFCRSIVGLIDIRNSNASPKEYVFTRYYVSGIGYGDSFINCYSVINDFKHSFAGSQKFIDFGGIGKADSHSKANFSNDDVPINISSLYERKTLYDGSTSFSSAEMQTPAFLEELNMYSMFEMDGPVWTQGANGGYPYIAELYTNLSIQPAIHDDRGRNSVFSLSGQRHTAPKKGINIVGGKKIIVK